MLIHITNHKSEEVISYALPIFIGYVEPSIASSFVSVSVDGANKKTLWPVTNGKFRAFTRLHEGVNKVLLRCKDATTEVILTFEKPRIEKIVRPVFIKCCDDDGHFQTPEWEDDSPESAMKRIALGAQLMQTFTAEKLSDEGLGRHTFHIETDANGEPRCHLFTSNLKLEEAVKKDGGELWCHFAKELMNTEEFPDCSDCKFLAFMSFTRYNYTGPTDKLPHNWGDTLKYTVGHTALGGGGLALFGSGNLHTWAEKLEDLTKRFTDIRKIDRTLFLDDSAYRQFHWANYSTGLGAALHELGHTFNLAHTPSGIMARGFDDMNKFYTVWESPNGKTSLRKKQSGVAKPSPVKKVVSKPQPILIQVETAFQQTLQQSSETMTIRNYDGTVTKVVHHSDGSQEIHNTKVENKSQNKSLPEGNVRPQVLDLKSSTTATVSPVSLTPKSPPGMKSPLKTSPVVESNNFRSNEGDAKWYRSSSVLLRFHKWFMTPRDDDPNQPPVFEDGESRSSAGLRLVEVRHTSSGDVAHHWEFLEADAPQKFLLTKSSIAKVLAEGATEFTVVVEDNCGNILRKDNVQLSSVRD